jgi:translation initiation factor IF-2
MGHVDHGKTTLLDAIRESKVTESEFGGITQHIGAYAVEVQNQKIVFLDTPGHEAFTAMRARGAKVTDEVILVVAADDGIMPQTIEAIDHARDAEVPIIVAINKIDTPGANPDRVMQELTKYGLTPEDWGGETICVRVSAKEQTNLDGLLEMILLQAEMLELKADPDRAAKGVIVEALLDKGRGPVATVLVQGGTLRVGDPFVVGQHYGKVRALLDDRGKKVKEAGPATPVEVLGLSGVPTAGDSFTVVKSDREARQVSESRQEQQQKLEFSKTAKITLEGLHQQIKEGETQELRIVIKADVHGSVEALKDALERLSTEQVRLQAIHGGVGAINESDVMLAAASNAIVIGFNVRPVAKAQNMAEKEQIDVRLYTVIYQAIDDVKKAMEGLLAPRYNELLTGQAQVQAVFNLPKGGKVAGCRVTDGKIQRNSVVRLVRDKQELFKGNLASLRRVKDDVKEVLNGYECGIRLENYNDVKEGDIIEAYTLEKISMTLEEAAEHHR